MSSSAGSSSGGLDGGVADAGGDAGPTVGAPGADCLVNADCFSNYCYRPYGSIGIGPGYCSAPCDNEQECRDFHGNDGYDYACLRVGARNRCLRSCDDGQACPNNDLCINGMFSLGSNPGRTEFGACISLADNACGGDLDCASEERCYVANDYHHLVKYCSTPRNGAGAVVNVKRQGEACDPTQNEPCTTSADCPATWTCEPAAPGGRRACIPPVTEQCAHGCQLSGFCTGFCDSDADCSGGTTRCSFDRIRLFHQGTGTPTDDLDGILGTCIAAPAAETLCGTRADCASVDAGGPVECLALQQAGDGGVAQRCYGVPGALVFARNGEPCNDDLATYPDIEVRLCSGACLDGVCGELCEAGTDCPMGWNCEEVLQGTVAIKACVQRRTCTADGVDGGCAADETCQWTLTGRSSFRACRARVGDLALGATCVPGIPPQYMPAAERCATGICAGFTSGAVCSGACSADADCPAGFACSTRTLVLDNRGTPDTTDDVTGQDSICVLAPGSRMACARPADCPEGEACRPIQRTGGVVTWCLSDVDGGAPLGATCGQQPCASDICIPKPREFGRAYCSEVCTADAECPMGLVCRRFNGTGAVVDAVKLCVEPDDPRIVP